MNWVLKLDEGSMSLLIIILFSEIFVFMNSVTLNMK